MHDIRAGVAAYFATSPRGGLFIFSGGVRSVSPSAFDAFLSGYRQARELRLFFSGTQDIYREAAARALSTGVGRAAAGRLAEEIALPKIEALANKLGLGKISVPERIEINEAFRIPRDLGGANYRVFDIYLPEQNIGMELTMEDLGSLSQHKIDQLADYVSTGTPTVLVNPR